MTKQDLIKQDVVMNGVLPNILLRVALDIDHKLKAYTTGMTRRYRILFLSGDQVATETSLYA